MPYNPNIHHRRSIRLKGYDYSQAGLYFITLCVENRVHLFGNIKDKNLTLNQYGKIAAEEWLKTSEIRENILLHEFIIMPNHFHAIIEILFSKNEKQIEDLNSFKSPSHTIGAIIRGYKGATTKKIKEIMSTGELQFAPTEKKESDELQFAPTEINLFKSIWQRNYYEHIIRDEKAYQNISNYIINNPAKWQEDKFYNS